MAKPSRGTWLLYCFVYVAVLVCCLGYVIEFVVHSADKSEANVTFTLLFGIAALVFLLFVDRLEWSKPWENRNKELNLALVFSAAATAFCDYYKTDLINAWGTNSGVRDYANALVLVVGGFILVLILIFKTRKSLKKSL